MIPKSLRFHGHGSLRYVYKNADNFHTRLFTLKVSKHPYRSRPRMAVIVSKRVHKSAVGRNLIRRRVYEILRNELPAIQEPRDIAIIVTSGEALHASHDEMNTMVHDAFKKAGLTT